MLMHHIDLIGCLPILIILIAMLVFPSTIVYSLSLVIYVTFLVVYIVTYSFVSGLLGLLILLVYVGAIMVIIRYICAVSPNIKYTYSLRVVALGSFMLFLRLLVFTLPPLSPLPQPETLSPSFLFTDLGIWFAIILCLFILIVLMYSTYTSPLSSSLRSTSLK
jgi:hypothetical protein